MAAPVIQFKRGSASSITAGIASFRAGEPGFTTDKYDFYIGLSSTSATNQFFGSARYWKRENATTAAQLRLVDKDGTNFVAIAASDTLSGIATYRLPNTTNGSSGDFLKLLDVTNGVYTLQWAAVPSGSFTVAAENGSPDTFTTGETLTFAAGEGIDTTVSNNQILIAGEAASSTNAGIASFSSTDFYFTNTYQAGITTATTATKGIASFNSTDFYVTAGAVGINTESIQDMIGSAVTAGINTNITVVYDDANNRINYFISTATSTVPGVASFNSSNFSITGAGAVTITYSPSAGIATYATTAGISTYATTAGIATYATSSGIATYATSAGIATYTTTAGISTRANTADVTATNAQTGNLVFATAGNGATLYNDTDLSYDSNANRLTALNITATTEVRTAAVKAADGVNAITISSVSGNVGIASDLTVTGSLYVAGNTTQVNTTSLQVEDRIIELGKVQGTPPSDTTWDLGILFNYYAASSNKKASVYWEGGVQRFLFASDVTESVLGINLPDSGAVGLGTTTPQLTSPTYAPIEVASLWMNDTAGQSVVASYLAADGLFTGSAAGRYLQNITVDAGTF